METPVFVELCLNKGKEIITISLMDTESDSLYLKYDDGDNGRSTKTITFGQLFRILNKDK